MHHVTPRRLLRASVCLAAAVITGCEGANQPLGPSIGGPSLNVGQLPPASQLCKVGPAGSYTFHVQSQGIGTLLLGNTFQVAAGQCVEFYQQGADLEQITITEINLPAGTSFNHATSQSVAWGEYPAGSVVNYPTNSVSVEIFNKPWVIRFYNDGPPPPPVNLAGCTPGFWKNSTGSWVGYTTGQSFDAVFGVNAFSPDITLLQALELGGGGVNALARHATAALLNASHSGVNYGMTPAQVIAAVQAALSGGDVEGTKNRLAAMNERGCGLANDNSF